MKAAVEKANFFNIIPWIKLLFGLALLIFLIFKVSTMQVLDIFSRLNFGNLILALFFALLAVFLSAWRWRVVLEAQGFSLSLKVLFTLYLEGLFFNNFLPSSIGGDAVRFLGLSREIKNYSGSFSSILGERVLSSVTLGLVSFVAAIFVFSALKELFFWVLAFLVICLFFFALFLFAPQFFIKGSRGFIEKYGLKSVSKEILQLRNAKTISKVVSLSLLFQLTLVFVNWAIFSGLSVNLNPFYYFIFIPITQAVSLLPLSFNGLGFREGSYVFLFGYVGLSSALSLAGALAFLLVVTFLSLSGGVIFAFKR